MKAQLTIAALFSAAAILTPASASPLILNSTFSTSNPGYICFAASTVSNCGTGSGQTQTAVNVTSQGYTGLFPGAGASATPNVAGASKTGVGVSGGNLELSSGYIFPSDGIVLDFANIPTTDGGQTLSQIQIKLFEQNTGAYYEIYGDTAVNGTGTNHQLLDGPTTTTPSTITYNQFSGFYNATGSYIVGLSNGDCDLAIESIQLTYGGSSGQTVPEPGTFVMAGMALLGVGVTMRKRRSKA